MKWKPVLYRGDNPPYEVSEYGDVRHLPVYYKNGKTKQGKILRPYSPDGRYLQVMLREPGKVYRPLIHTLVALAFLDEPTVAYEAGKLSVNHKDCNRLNNHYSNLEWATPKENSEHAVVNGLIARGEEATNAFFTEPQVLEIRRRRLLGEGRNALAREYGVSNYAIYAICSRKSWRHI